MPFSKINKTILSLALALLCATVAQADSSYLAAADGYRTDDYLTGQSFDTFSAVDEDSILLCDAEYGIKIVNIVTGQVESSLGTVPYDYTSSNINPHDDLLYLWASFVEKDPTDGSYWVGFTNDGNDDDRIYQVTSDGAGTWTWTHRATLKCNFDAKLSGSDLLVSTNPGGTGQGINQIVLLDDSGSNDHTVLANVTGFSAGVGLAVDGSGDVFYTTYVEYGATTSELLRFTGTQLQNAATTGTPCELGDAEVLYGSLYGAYDTEVDAAGHVVFNGNIAYSTPGNYVKLWNAGNPGELVDVATCTSGSWLTQLDVEGDLLSAGGFAYAATYQGTITKITRLIPGDANGDGTVDGSDATILASHWQESGASWSDGDFNGDGNVDGSDATLLASHWQESLATTTPTAVPEPSMVVLLAALALVGVVRRFS